MTDVGERKLMAIGGCDATDADAVLHEIAHGGSPYRRVLSAFALSELAALVASTAYGDRLWLRNPDVLTINGQTIDTAVLRYICTADVPAERLLEELIIGLQQWPRVFGRSTEPYFSGTGEVRSEGEVYIELDFRGRRVPVVIYIDRRDDMAIEPVTRAIELLVDVDRGVDILELSPEDEAAEALCEIFDKMELVGDMGVYGNLAALLNGEPLRGHRVAESFARLCEKRNVGLTAERYALWESYGTYIYMRRKWISYIKRHKNMSFAWEYTHNLVSQFARPIYDAIGRGEVFFGDWMPELGRFLD